MVRMVEEARSPGVAVVTRGDVGSDERAYAQRKVEHVGTLVQGPVLFARIELSLHADPARERPAFAKAELDVNGRMVRAHAAAATMFEAIDQLDARLRERLERAAHHEADEHLRFRGGDTHEWHHAEYVAPPPVFFPRPVDERELVRHKTFSWGEMTPDEAASDLEALDHDFYLFTNLETGEDNVIARSGSGYELSEPSATCSLHETAVPVTRSLVRPATMTTEEARETLDLTDRPFVFFLDPNDGRGRVLYRRYDGHYGLLEPATTGMR
jgi:ribosome-associated translation inhibitor RaiA